MRIVCPESISQLLPWSPPSNPNQDRKGKRATATQRHAKITNIVDSKKKNDIRLKAQARKYKNFHINFVFVGNLESSISQQRLSSFFEACGDVTRVTIRCSRGQAITAGVAVPAAVRTERDRQYATVEFKDTQSARKALSYHGRVLDGCQLVVSASAADLPEVNEIVQTHISRIRQITARPVPPNRFKRPERPLVAQVTERFIDFRVPGTDWYNFFGLSWPKCIL